MPSEKIHGPSHVRGEVRLHSVPVMTYRDRVLDMIRERKPDPAHPRYAHGWVPRHWDAVTAFQPNALLFEWGAVFGSLLLRKGLNYGIGGMYVEYENVASPGDPVSPPDFTRGADEGVEYYNGLSDSTDRDYLRVPLVAASMDSADPANFPKGNRTVFFAQTTGVEGVHGKPFSDADNSVVFGGALVAFVDDEDHTRDLVLSRFYVSTDKQQPKLSTSQVGFEWKLTLQ